MEKLTLESLFLHHISGLFAISRRDAGSIQRAMENFNWQYVFESKIINEKVQVLREAYILSNFASCKSLIFINI